MRPPQETTLPTPSKTSAPRLSNGLVALLCLFVFTAAAPAAGRPNVVYIPVSYTHLTLPTNREV